MKQGHVQGTSVSLISFELHGTKLKLVLRRDALLDGFICVLMSAVKSVGQPPTEREGRILDGCLMSSKAISGSFVELIVCSVYVPFF